MPSITDLIQLRDSVIAAQANADRAETDAKSAAQLANAKRQESDAAVQRAKDAQAALERAQQAKADLPAATQAKSDAANELNAINNQLAQLAQQIDLLARLIDRLERTPPYFVPPAWRDALEQLERDQQELLQQKQDKEASLNQLQAKVDELEKEAAQLEEARKAADEANAQAASLDSEATRLENSAQSAQQAADAARRQATDLANQYEQALGGLVSNLEPNIPIVLLPVRLETRFVRRAADQPPQELLIRIYPDDIHKDTHEIGLTDAEVQWGQHFWRETWRAGLAARADSGYPKRRAQELSAWQQLAQGFGPARATYIARVLIPSNEDARPTELNTDVRTPLSVEPEFKNPLPQGRNSSWTRAARARALPDRWLATGYGGGVNGTSQSQWGNLIPAELFTSPDPSMPPPSDGSSQPKIPVDPGIRWMVDFAEAEKVGMGIRMDVSAPEFSGGFSRLTVVGIKGTLDKPGNGATELHELLEAHHFTWGCSFVPQATPTNNTETVKSGYSRQDAGFETSFLLERERPEIELESGSTSFTLGDDSNAGQAALALGLDIADMNTLRYADECEQRDARNFNQVLWHATLGYYLNQLFNHGLRPDQPDVWREYFVNNVRARGPLPTLRVGRQPYGLLPVTSLDQWGTERTELVGILKQLREVWGGQAGNVAHAGLTQINPHDSSSVGKDLVEVLGMDPISSSYSWRWARGMGFFQEFWGLPGQGVDPQKITEAVEWLQQQVRDQLQYLAIPINSAPRLTSFAEVAFDWAGPLVQAGAVSETQSLQPNYISALLDYKRFSLRDVHQETNGLIQLDRPKPLLYQLLRHAILLAYANQVLQADAPGGLSQYEPELVDMQLDTSTDPKGDPLRSQTLWRALEQKGDALRSKGEDVPEPLGSFLKALSQIAGLPTAALQRLLGETLDLASHRLDAWITSPATWRLNKFRAQNPTGVYLGGYGWLEEVRPRSNQSLSDGFVHAPSVAQASTAAVLRSGYLTHQGQPEGAQLEIDLSSRRVRLALELIDGVRHGQPLGALLGYRFERAVYAASVSQGPLTVNRLIAPLRDLAPLTGGKLVPKDPSDVQEAIAANNVVDGLKLLDLYQKQPVVDAELSRQLTDQINQKLQERKHADLLPDEQVSQNELKVLVAAWKELRDSADAVSDLALAEGVHQAVQGNYMRAGATLDAISRGESPGEIHVVATPQAGVNFTQRLVALFSATPPAQGKWTRNRARAIAEPVLNGWAEELLGDPHRVRYNALCFNPGKDPFQDAPDYIADVRLDALGWCALDVIYAPPITDEPQQTELELSLKRAAILQNPATIKPNAAVRLIFGGSSFGKDDLTLPQLSELARALRGLVTNSRALDAHDLARAGTAADPGIDPAVLNSRAAAVLNSWQSARDTLYNLFHVDELKVPADAPFTLPAELIGKEANLLDLFSKPELRLEPAVVATVLDMPALAKLSDLRTALDAFSAFAVQGAVPRSINSDPSPATRELIEHAQQARRDLVTQAVSLYTQIRDIQDGKLAAIKGTSADDALSRLALFFGEGFRVLAPFKLGQPNDLSQSLKRRATANDAGAAETALWLMNASGVRDGARHLATVQTYGEFVSADARSSFRVAQFPFDDQDRWNVPMPESINREGATSIVIQTRADPDITQWLVGLMIDDWVELVPNSHIQTAITLHYDAPGAQAPQAILLAVSPVPDKPWDIPTLEKIVGETLDLAKVRAVDYNALFGMGHLLPAVFIANNSGGDPYGDTVSTTFAVKGA